MKALKACHAPACSLRSLKVRTDKDECIACGADLKAAFDLGDLLKDFDPFGSPFGKGKS